MSDNQHKDQPPFEPIGGFGDPVIIGKAAVILGDASSRFIEDGIPPLEACQAALDWAIALTFAHSGGYTAGYGFIHDRILFVKSNGMITRQFEENLN